MFAGENIGGFSIYTEGNRGKTKGLQIKLGQIDQQLPNLPKLLPYSAQFIRGSK